MDLSVKLKSANDLQHVMTPSSGCLLRSTFKVSEGTVNVREGGRRREVTEYLLVFFNLLLQTPTP